MATRKPLVIVGGRIQQLQSGDSLAGASDFDKISLTNDESGSIVCGCPVYADAAAGVKKAKANAIGTADVIGLVQDTSISASAAGFIQTGGILTLTTAQWDAITGGSGGLVFNTRYYLDPTTAGLLTTTAPSTVGQLVVLIGRALSTVDMELIFESPVLL